MDISGLNGRWTDRTLPVRNSHPSNCQFIMVFTVHSFVKLISLFCIVMPVGPNKSAEVRSHWTQPRDDGTNAQAVPINDAPLGILTAHFMGRKSELAKIRSMLTSRQDNIPAQCAIVGMPGLGKTQLALKHTLEVFDQARGPIIFWTSAATTEKLAQGLCKILDLVDHVDRDHTDQNVRLSAAQRWLEGTGHDFPLPWLLVLDNVNEESVPFLREHLPRTNGSGAMLFTMRSVDVASALVTSDMNQSILELEVLSPADASNLLLAELQASKPDEIASQIVKAEKLVKSVGRLPLAIGHVASFANQHLKGLDYILHLFEDKHAMEVLSWDNHLSKYEQRSVMITFSSKLDDLAAASPVNSLLLQMLSLFDPESIALDMIKQGAYPIRDLRAYSEERKPEFSEPPMPMQKGTLPQPKRRFMQKLRDKLHRRAGSPSRIDGVTGQTEASTCNSQDEDINDSRDLEISKLLDDPVEFPKAIQLLRKSSFLTHQPSEDGGDVRIHDLVRSMIRHRAGQSMWDSLCFRMAAATVDYVFPEAKDFWLSSECWPLCERVLPHYRSLVAVQMEQKGCSIDLTRVCRAVASYLKSRGRKSEAIKTIKEMLPLQEKHHGVKDLDFLENLKELASMNDKDTPEAESLLEQSLKLHRKALGDTHLNTLIVMTNLAKVYSNQDRHEEALTLMESVVDTMKIKFGPEHEVTLEKQLDLAAVYINQGRYMEAESLYEESLDTAIRTSGNHGVSRWYTLCELGRLKFHLYHLDAANLLLTQADACGQALNVAETIPILDVRCYLGRLHKFQGNYLEAESLLREVLTKEEKLYGANHWFTMTAMKGLAWLYVNMERFGDAEALFLRTREILERLPDRLHDLRRTVAALAFVVEQQGRASEAEAMYKTVLDEGSEWSDLAFLGAAPLSRLLLAQGQTEKAQDLFKGALEALRIYLEFLYRNGIYDTQEDWHRLATIGRVLEDEEMSEIALKVQEEKLGLAHPVTQKTVQALLKIWHEKGKTDKEEALSQRCKDAGIDAPLFLEGERPQSKAGGGEGDNAGRDEGTVLTSEDASEGIVQNDLDLTPGRPAKSLGKRRMF